MCGRFKPAAATWEEGYAFLKVLQKPPRPTA